MTKRNGRDFSTDGYVNKIDKFDLEYMFTKHS